MDLFLVNFTQRSNFWIILSKFQLKPGQHPTLSEIYNSSSYGQYWEIRTNKTKPKKLFHAHLESYRSVNLRHENIETQLRPLVNQSTKVNNSKEDERWGIPGQSNPKTKPKFMKPIYVDSLDTDEVRYFLQKNYPKYNKTQIWGGQLIPLRKGKIRPTQNTLVALLPEPSYLKINNQHSIGLRRFHRKEIKYGFWVILPQTKPLLKRVEILSFLTNQGLNLTTGILVAIFNNVNDNPEVFELVSDLLTSIGEVVPRKREDISYVSKTKPTNLRRSQDSQQWQLPNFSDLFLELGMNLSYQRRPWISKQFDQNKKYRVMVEVKEDDMRQNYNLEVSFADDQNPPDVITFQRSETAVALAWLIHFLQHLSSFWLSYPPSLLDIVPTWFQNTEQNLFQKFNFIKTLIVVGPILGLIADEKSKKQLLAQCLLPDVHYSEESNFHDLNWGGDADDGRLWFPSETYLHQIQTTHTITGFWVYALEATENAINEDRKQIMWKKINELLLHSGLLSSSVLFWVEKKAELVQPDPYIFTQHYGLDFQVTRLPKKATQFDVKTTPFKQYQTSPTWAYTNNDSEDLKKENFWLSSKNPELHNFLSGRLRYWLGKLANLNFIQENLDADFSVVFKNKDVVTKTGGIFGFGATVETKSGTEETKTKPLQFYVDGASVPERIFVDVLNGKRRPLLFLIKALPDKKHILQEFAKAQKAIQSEEVNSFYGALVKVDASDVTYLQDKITKIDIDLSFQDTTQMESYIPLILDSWGYFYPLFIVLEILDQEKKEVV